VADVSAYSNTSYTISTAQTGDGSSTDTLDRRRVPKSQPAAVEITTTVGAAPTVTIALQGSQDNTTWYNIPYSLVATPETVAVANIVITTAVTTIYLLRPNHAWRYIKAVRSSNNNVTVTVKVHF
jgi:hypothetical protein